MTSKNKKILAGSLGAVIILFLLIWTFFPPSNFEDDKSIKVGAVFTLTGGTAFWSEQLQRGMNIALEEENKNGAVPIKVIYEDVQGQPQQATSTFQKLAEVEKTSVIISVFTPVSQPLRTLADNNEIPLLATVVSVRDFGTGHPWSIRDFPTQEQMAAPLGNYAVKKLGLKSAAALVVNDDYGRDGMNAFSETFKNQGGKWLGAETFAQNDTDIRAQSLKIKSLNPEAIIVVGRDQSLALAIKQLHEAGFTGQILSVNCLDEPSVWEIAGDSVNNAIFISTFVDLESNEKAIEFASKYRDKYKIEPSYVVVYGYTIMKYLIQILRDTNGNKKEIIEKLKHLNVASIRGQLTTEPNGDVLSPVAVYKVSGMKKELIVKPEELLQIK